MHEINEFNLLSRDEKIAWCRARLTYFDEAEADLRRRTWTADSAEALSEITIARPVLLETLRTLEEPTLWQRLNFTVNRSAARDTVRKDLKRRRKPIICPDCRGSGRRWAGAGAYNYMEKCPCGGVIKRYEGSPEVDIARDGADRLRRQIDESWRG